MHECQLKSLVGQSTEHWKATVHKDGSVVASCVRQVTSPRPLQDVWVFFLFQHSNTQNVSCAETRGGRSFHRRHSRWWREEQVWLHRFELDSWTGRDCWIPKKRWRKLEWLKAQRWGTFGQCVSVFWNSCKVCWGSTKKGNVEVLRSWTDPSSTDGFAWFFICNRNSRRNFWLVPLKTLKKPTPVLITLLCGWSVKNNGKLKTKGASSSWCEKPKRKHKTTEKSREGRTLDSGAGEQTLRSESRVSGQPIFCFIGDLFLPPLDYFLSKRCTQYPPEGEPAVFAQTPGI